MQRPTRGGERYAVAFVDMRMPPGWDGIETIEHVWKSDPRIEVVVCTANSDYTWDETVAMLGRPDHLVLLSKPFDPADVRVLVELLTYRWTISHRIRGLPGIFSAPDSRTSNSSATTRRTARLGS